ncbi:unnamed protein product [Somion occarium]|uniref:N-acetyltransferase domain-containing protein n=1 Tax=Somion occarium TaxID=3059160 RepID=A0ABP1CT68_9APHY
MTSATEWTLRKLTKATPEELDEAARVAEAAFKGDEFNKACVGGNWDLLFPFWRGTLGASDVAGENWVATVGDKIVGVAGWFPAGRLLLDSPDQAKAGWNKFTELLTPELGKWWMEYFLPKYEEATTKAFGPNTKKDSWHLQTLCILPEFQRRGIGHGLVNVKKNEIIAEGAGQAMCLESEVAKNTELYKSWGFEDKGKFSFESDVTSSRFDMWCLYKK